MTLDGFLTFLTLILAAFAITPNIVRLRLLLRWKVPTTLSIIAFIIVIYLEFWDTLAPPCPEFFGRACPTLSLISTGPLKPNQWAFFVVITWMMAAAIPILRQNISSRSLPAFSDLLASLMYERRYAEIVALIEPTLPLIVRATNRNLFQMRVHDWLRKLDVRRRTHEELLESLDTTATSRKLLRLVREGTSKVSLLVPSNYKIERAGKEVCRTIYSNSALADFIVNHRPEFGVKMLACDLYERREFSDSFMTSLMSSPHSLLYQEIAQNQNIGQGGYFFPEHNRLLHFLMVPSSNAQKLEIYRPVGEHFIARVRAENTKYVEYLNGAADLYQNDERWRDSSFIAIQFFDLMVTAAIWDDIPWHMWLFYYPHFMEALLSIYDAQNPDLDLESEFPTRASFLIKEIIGNLLKWIRTMFDLPDGSIHKTIARTTATHENSNIPKSAALALGICLSHLLATENLPEKFRESCHDLILRGLRDIPESLIRAALINCIIRRGPLGPNEAHGDGLMDLFSNLDPIMRLDLRDYEAELQRQYGRVG